MIEIMYIQILQMIDLYINVLKLYGKGLETAIQTEGQFMNCPSVTLF
jgi:hypothetical protein